MTGEQFNVHFLIFRYLMVAVAVVGLVLVVRFSSVRSGLAALGLLGITTWLFTWMPLARPYGAQPGSQSSFELAVAVRGAVGDTPLEGWVVGRRNPRPAWSVFWHGLAWGQPERARRLYGLAAPAALLFFPLVVFVVFRRRDNGGDWEGASVAFAAVFASSVALDAFRPFGLFHRSFFLAPHRPLCLLVALGALGLTWRGGWWREALAGLLVGVVAWTDLTVFAWALLSLLAWDVFRAALRVGPVRTGAWPVVLLGGVLGLPQVLALLRGELLLRGLARQDFEGYRVAFRDVFAATTDMEWILVLALFSVPILWRRRQAVDLGVLSVMAAGLALCILAALTFQRGPLVEPDWTFHLLRFSVAAAAGVGGYHVAERLLRYVAAQQPTGTVFRKAHAWLARRPRAPLAFTLMMVFLLPRSAIFLWHPLRMDPLYYPSLRPADRDEERLARWLVANTRTDEPILTGAVTGERVAVLSGRPVLMADRVLTRGERRARERELRALLLSGDARRMREALRDLQTSVLILDPTLREVYGRLDPAHLVSSGVFTRVEQIGERYTIYRAR